MDACSSSRCHTVGMTSAIGRNYLRDFIAGYYLYVIHQWVTIP